MSETAGGQPFDAGREGRRLIRQARWATLATLESGAPYASLIGSATDVDGAPLLLISRLALHTRNLEADPRCSILFAEVGAGDPMVHPRISLRGRAARTTDPRARRRYLGRQNGARMYADFADFSFWRVEPEGGHLVAGFGRIVDLAPLDLLTSLEGAEGLVAAEEDAISHVNEDHADTLDLYATALLGRTAGGWRLTGVDPEGLDLVRADEAARLLFPKRVTTPGALREGLRGLADAARRTW